MKNSLIIIVERRHWKGKIVSTMSHSFFLNGHIGRNRRKIAIEAAFQLNNDYKIFEGHIFQRLR